MHRSLSHWFAIGLLALLLIVVTEGQVKGSQSGQPQGNPPPQPGSEAGVSAGEALMKADAEPVDPAPSVSGLYYLRGKDPQSQTDVGSLSKEMPVNDEMTFCGAFIVFHYHGPGVHEGKVKIRNIYYHIWQKKPENPFEGEIFDLGYNTNGLHTGEQLESITIDTKQNVSETGNYRLVQAMQYLDPELACLEGNEIFDFEVIAQGNGPRFRCHANQYSFVILNLEDDAVLKTLDRDQDHINDYDELFVHCTNPYDADTDNDNVSDYEEVMAPLFGFPQSDPNDYSSTSGIHLLASLKADIPAISSAVGGEVRFSLNAGAHNQHRDYLLLGSATGTSPGIPLPGNLLLPLTYDGFTETVIAGLNSHWFFNFAHELDAMGHASALLRLPPSSLWAGKTLHFSFVCLDPIDVVSNVVDVEVND